MAICIAIAVGKGGVGKTATTTNLAVAMAQDNNKVLVVDTDAQANTTMFLTGVKLVEKDFKGKAIFDMMRAYGIVDTQHFVHPSHVHDNINVIVSNASTPLINQQIDTLAKNSGIDKEEFLAAALSEVADDYDFILIDTPPAQDDLMVQNAIVASDYIIMPFKTEEQSVDSLKITNELRMELAEKHGETKILGILPTVVEKTALTSYYLDFAFVTMDPEENPEYETLAKPFGEKLFRTKIRKGNIINESTLERKPAVLVNKKANPSKDYYELWEEIKERLKQDN